MNRPLPNDPDSQIVPLIECFHLDRTDNDSFFPLPLHNHFFSEVLLVREGACRVTRNSVHFRVQAGEAIYISPLIPHSVAPDNGPVAFDVVKFRATGFQALLPYISALHSYPVDIAQNTLGSVIAAEEIREFRIDETVSRIIHEYTSREFAYDLQLFALLYHMIAGLFRIWHRKKVNFPELPGRERNPVQDIPAYIEQHISEPLRVETLAEKCGLSYPWFAKQFREHFGISCKQCISRIRVEAAEHYLIFTGLDLEEISWLTGYHDASHLTKEFRSCIGLTPGQFRERMTMKTDNRRIRR